MYIKKHADLSEFCYGGFLSQGVCFDQTAVVFCSADFRAETQSQVIQSNVRVTEARLPCWQGAGWFSRIFSLNHFPKMLLWLILLAIQSQFNSSRHISTALPCTCIYSCMYAWSTKTVEPLLKSPSLYLDFFFACCMQCECWTDTLSGQREIVSVADNNLPTLFFCLQQEAGCVILRILGSLAS